MAYQRALLNLAKPVQCSEVSSTTSNADGDHHSEAPQDAAINDNAALPMAEPAPIQADPEPAGVEIAEFLVAGAGADPLQELVNHLLALINAP